MGSVIREEVKKQVNSDDKQVNDDVDDIIRESEDRMKEIDQEIAGLEEEAIDKRIPKPVERLEMSAGPGEFKSTKSYTNANVKSTKKKAKSVKRKEYTKAMKGACHLLTQGMKPTDEYEHKDAYILATIMINLVQTYSLKAGIKRFGEEGRSLPRKK